MGTCDAQFLKHHGILLSRVREEFNCQLVILSDSPRLRLAAHNTVSHLNSASNKHYAVVNKERSYTEETIWVLPMNSFKITSISTKKDQTIGQKLPEFCLPASAHQTFDARR